MTLELAEQYVAEHRHAFWDGWTLKLFSPNPKGYHSKNGIFRNGRWGFVRTVNPNENGLYVI